MDGSVVHMKVYRRVSVDRKDLEACGWLGLLDEENPVYGVVKQEEMDHAAPSSSRACVLAAPVLAEREHEDEDDDDDDGEDLAELGDPVRAAPASGSPVPPAG